VTNWSISQEELGALARQLLDGLSSKVFGQNHVIEQVVLTVLCGGHALLTGAPGVAKTTLVRNLASSLGCGYKRIQFTPDLTPFDILGGDTIQFDEHNPDIKRVVFSPGPIFAPFILADEINRASPRTQSALLEAMQEKQVSIAGATRPLPRPFYVFATQNPIESDGTFPLPDAQLDRFLVNIEVPYPDADAELRIALLPGQFDDLQAFQHAPSLFSNRQLVESMPARQELLEAIVRIVRNTRPESSALKVTKNYLEYGASPRASQALVIASKALALLRGDKEVTLEHVFSIAPSVLRHRCVMNFKAISERKAVAEVIEEILKETVL
jgi:MoxR-like ATPase